MTRSRLRKVKQAEATHRTRSALSGVPLASAVSALLAGSPGAFAQGQAENGVLENVIVTAQKRQENLQDVPLSIQALGTAKLEELHVTAFDDYVKFLPSVSYQSGGPGFARVFMRGVASGDNGNHSGPLPSVGMYLDEQPITTIQGPLDVHIYDIARVESLAGPQGTLYGASSQAGTIRIISNKPDPSKFSASYDVQGNSVDHGGNGYLAEGYVNLPLTENAAVRLVGWKRHDAGYIDNVAGTRTFPTSGITASNAAIAKKDYNDVDTVGARAALKVDLNDSWSVTPTVMGQEQKSHGNFGFDPSVGDLQLTHMYPENSKDRWAQAALTLEGKISNFDLVYAGSYLKRNVDTNLDYADYSFFYDNLLNDEGEYYFGEFFTDNAGNMIDPSQHIRGKDRYKKMSHELRISSPGDQKLRFVGGLFMQRQEHVIEQAYKIDGLATASEVTGWPDTFWLTKQERIDRDYAVFGEVSYDLTEKLTATGGLRFFEAKNSLEGFYGFGLTNPFESTTGEASAECIANPADFMGAPCRDLDKTVDEKDHTHRLNLTYHLDDDRMIYATWSRGFRPGGVNRRGTFPPYKADFLANYELGWKTSWAGNRLRFNGAFFLEDWDDFQFSFLGENGLTNVTNAGGARIKGLEMDIDWAATADLTLSGGLALLEPKLTQFFCQKVDADGKEFPEGVCAPDDSAAKGTQLPVTPKFKANLTARYGFAVGTLDAHLQGSLIYQGRSRSALLSADEAVLGKQGAYGLADFSAELGRDQWSVQLFVNNAFDERADSYRYTECDTSICTKNYIVTNRPRTIGLKFGQEF
jgi:outer membrane receptor protein involved in Fe transport